MNVLPPSDGEKRKASRRPLGYHYKRTEIPHERPLERYSLDVTLVAGSWVSVLRTGGLDDGAWGVDVELNLRSGAATVEEARSLARAILEAADLADQSNHGDGPPALRPAMAAVVAALASTAGPTGISRIGQQELANLTNRSIRTIRRAIDQLEKEGRILRSPQSDHRGRRTVDAYLLVSSDKRAS